MTMTAAGLASSPQERLQARLADPATIASLDRLLDRVDLMAFVLEALDGFLRRGDTVVDSISESVREVRRTTAFDETGRLLGSLPRLARTGADLAEMASGPAFSNVLHSDLLERLGQPETLRLLGTLVEKLEVAVFALEAIDGFLRRGDEIAESAAAVVGQLRETTAGVDLEAMRSIVAQLPKVLDTLARLADSHALDRVPELVGAMGALSESGMLDPKVVRVLAEVGHRMAAAYEDAGAAAPPVGPVGLMKALGDPDVQRAMGLAVAVAKRYGRQMR